MRFHPTSKVRWKIANLNLDHRIFIGPAHIYQCHPFSFFLSAVPHLWALRPLPRVLVQPSVCSSMQKESLSKVRGPWKPKIRRAERRSLCFIHCFSLFYFFFTAIPSLPARLTVRHVTVLILNSIQIYAPSSGLPTNAYEVKSETTFLPCGSKQPSAHFQHCPSDPKMKHLI